MSTNEAGVDGQDVVIEGNGQQSSLLKGEADGKGSHGVKGHSSNASPNKVGTVIGIFANGFAGASAHSANGMQNGYMAQGCAANHRLTLTSPLEHIILLKCREYRSYMLSHAGVQQTAKSFICAGLSMHASACHVQAR